MHPNRIQFRVGDSTKSLEQGNVLSFAQGDFTIAHGGGAADPGKAVPSLYLLFAVGQCPDRDAVLRAVHAAEGLAVSIDGAAAGASAGEDARLQIVTRGLTFDLQGVVVQDKSGPAYERGQTISPAGSDNIYDAIAIAAGPHLSSGATTVPVLKGQVRAAALLGKQLPTLAAYSWSAAGNVVDAKRFSHLSEEWEDGGVFPTEFFVRFRRDLDEGVTSRGLEIFTGQELRIEPDLVDAIPDPVRLAMRIAAQLVPMGKMEEPQDFKTPDGRDLRLQPSRNARYVRAFLR